MPTDSTIDVSTWAMSRQRHSSRRRACYRYPWVLTDKQREIISAFVRPQAESRRRPRHDDLGQVVNAILYLLRTGCSWRQLPLEFPARETVYGYFRRRNEDGRMAGIHNGLREAVSKKEGRNAARSTGIVESQLLRGADTVGRATRGYDAGKEINRRRRHIVVDTIGLLMVTVVTAASMHDRDGRKLELRLVRKDFPGIKLIGADGGYAGGLDCWARTVAPIALEIVKRHEDHTFVVLPRRWVVERTFAWLVKCRRLGWADERLPETSEACVHWAMIGRMLRRLAPPPGP